MLFSIMIILFFAVGIGYLGEGDKWRAFFIVWLFLSGIAFVIFLPISFYTSGNRMSKLSVDYKINIQNNKILMETLNDRAKFDNQLSDAVVDAPNMGQSQRASEAVSDYVTEINQFNEELRSARYRRSLTPILRFFYFGFLAPIPEGIDYIKLN